MGRISGQAEYCLNRAAACRALARDERDPAAKAALHEMRRRWEALARSYALAEKISGHLQWQSNRVA